MPSLVRVTKTRVESSVITKFDDRIRLLIGGSQLRGKI